MGTGKGRGGVRTNTPRPFATTENPLLFWSLAPNVTVRRSTIPLPKRGAFP